MADQVMGEVALAAVEEWRLAGIDVFLGRVTIQELHDLGAKLLKRIDEEWEFALESYVELQAEENADRIAELEAENEKLKKKIKRLKGES